LNFEAPTFLFGLICLSFAAAYVFAEWKQHRLAACLTKAAASASFLVLALSNGATGFLYGRIILIALVFSLLGDMLLLSRQSVFLVAGIAAFLAAHIAYAVAFSSRLLEPAWFAAASFVLIASALFILRWLWKYLDRLHKIAVASYLAALTAMASLAVATLTPTIAVGALAFAVSDISVARDRFVERSPSNKVWGIPLYYFAQVLFAISVLADN
jgi:uncharacterized membrane protein YhhN